MSQALFPDTNVPQELVTIFAPFEHDSSHAMSTAAVVGIAVGVVAPVIILLGIAYLTRRRWLPKTSEDSKEYHPPGVAKAELDCTAVDDSQKHVDPTSGLVEADCDETLIPGPHAAEFRRPTAELSGPSATAELPSDLPGPRVHCSPDGRYELP